MAAAARKLVPQPLPKKLLALEQEQKDLLKKVAATEKKLARLGRRAREAAAAVMSRVAPMMDELNALDIELHRLFQDLLKPKRALPKAQRAKVIEIYRELILSGQIPELPSGPPSDEDDPPVGAPSAPRAAASASAMKDVYRRLAIALHPDRAADEADRALRTEWMKEVTVAYGQGDLARLLELERVRGARPSTSAEDLDRRCAALTRANEELRAQLDSLEREVKAARRSPEVKLARGMSRSQQRNQVDPIDEMVEDTEADLMDLRVARDFVRDFRDGTITYKQFVAGPGADEDFVVPPGVPTIEFQLDLDLGGPARPESRRKKRK
jgi:predicted  nucleic acid-binding Zn-ribbon protein